MLLWCELWPHRGQHASPKPVRIGGRNGRLDVGELVGNGSKEGSSTESMKVLVNWEIDTYIHRYIDRYIYT